MTKGQVKTVLKFAFVAAIVGVSVNYFIEPAAKRAVRAR